MTSSFIIVLSDIVIFVVIAWSCRRACERRESGFALGTGVVLSQSGALNLRGGPTMRGRKQGIVQNVLSWCQGVKTTTLADCRPIRRGHGSRSHCRSRLVALGLVALLLGFAPVVIANETAPGKGGDGGRTPCCVSEGGPGGQNSLEGQGGAGRSGDGNGGGGGGGSGASGGAGGDGAQNGGRGGSGGTHGYIGQ